MAEAGDYDRKELVIVSKMGQEVTGEEEASCELAMMIAAARVMTQEYPAIRMRSIDVGGSEQEVEQGVEEVMRGGEEQEVAIRGRHRWEKRYERVRLEQQQQQEQRGGGAREKQGMQRKQEAEKERT